MLTCGSLFSGVGLMDYGLFLAGLEHKWFVESVEYRRRILAQRFPGCEVHDDVRTFDAVRVERVDVIAGGFPCRGASTAGPRTGFDHPETALWREFARIIRDARPRYVVVENVANLLAIHDGALWGTVLRDLAALGFDAWWDCLPAAAFGAPHLRDRVFLVAHAAGDRRGTGAEDHAEGHDEWRDAGRGDAGFAAHADNGGRGAHQQDLRAGQPDAGRFPWGKYDPAIRRWEQIVGPVPEPFIPRVAHGRPRGVDGPRIAALGDGVLVHAARYIGELLMALEATA